MGMENGISFDNYGWLWLAVLTLCGSTASVGTVGSDGAKTQQSQSVESAISAAFLETRLQQPMPRIMIMKTPDGILYRDCRLMFSI